MVTWQTILNGMNILFMKTYTLKVNEKTLNEIMIGLSQRYLHYGDQIDDESVYRINCEIDEMIHNIKQQIKEQQNDCVK